MAVQSRRKRNMSDDELYHYIQQNITITETGCHEWNLGKNSSGYGHIWHNRKYELVHRWIYQYLKNIKLITEEHVLHRCDNPICCNINHLFIDSNLGNIKDKVAKGRQMKGEDVHTSKLTRLKVEEIKHLLDEGELTQKEIAEIYNVHKVSISNIKRGKTWKN